MHNSELFWLVFVAILKWAGPHTFLYVRSTVHRSTSGLLVSMNFQLSLLLIFSDKRICRWSPWLRQHRDQHVSVIPGTWALAQEEYTSACLRQYRSVLALVSYVETIAHHTARHSAKPWRFLSRQRHAGGWWKLDGACSCFGFVLVSVYLLPALLIVLGLLYTV